MWANAVTSLTLMCRPSPPIDHLRINSVHIRPINVLQGYMYVCMYVCTSYCSAVQCRAVPCRAVLTSLIGFCGDKFNFDGEFDFAIGDIAAPDPAPAGCSTCSCTGGTSNT